VAAGVYGAQEHHAWQSLAKGRDDTGTRDQIRTTVASLPVKTFCQELLIMAFLPMLRLAKQAAIHGCLAAMEEDEVVPSRLVDSGQVESQWIEVKGGALER
jgi:hypothetical protein